MGCASRALASCTYGPKLVSQYVPHLTPPYNNNYPGASDKKNVNERFLSIKIIVRLFFFLINFLRSPNDFSLPAIEPYVY